MVEITGPLGAITEAVAEVIVRVAEAELEMVKLMDEDERRRFMDSYLKRLERGDAFLSLFSPQNPD